MFLENSQNRDAGRKSPLADSFLSRISENELRHWVETISFPRHFEAEAAANKKAAAILTEWLQGMGYTVQEQGPWRNLLAGDPEKAKVIVGAHYDSVPGSPGADDNGSALAAMLGCAQALAEAAFRDELLFVAFNREEDDLMGSKDFVAEYQGPAEAAYILEMVGYASDETGSQKLPNLPIKLPDQGNFLGLVSNFQSRKLARSFLQCAHDHEQANEGSDRAVAMCHAELQRRSVACFHEAFETVGNLPLLPAQPADLFAVPGTYVA